MSEQNVNVNLNVGDSRGSRPARDNQPQRSFLVTFFLSLFLGIFGADRFYLGKTGSALAKLFTFGGFGVWYLIDLILLLANKAFDKQGRELLGYQKGKFIALGAFGLILIIGILSPKSDVGSATNGSNSSTDSNNQPAATETWQTVVELSGKTDKVSQTFTLGDGEKRITYTFDGGSLFLYTIYMEPAGTDISTQGAIPLFMGTDPVKNEVSAIQRAAGDYFVDVRAANVKGNWTIKIEELK